MTERLKSAYELAMERLRAKETDGGGPALTGEQRERIAAIRRDFKSRRDEAEFLQKGAVEKALAAGKPEKIVELEEGHRRDRERLDREEQERIGEVRGD
jgi:hypothetical protein